MSEDARAAVLGRLRRALGRGRDVDALRRAMRQRLSEPHANLIPARADLDHDGRIRLFIAQAEAVHTTVRRVDRYRDLPRAVIDYLRLHNLPPRLAMASDPAARAGRLGEHHCWRFTTDPRWIRTWSD